MKKIVSVMCLLLACLSLSAASHVKNVTAIGEVLGDGAKTTAIAIEYDAPIDGNSLSTATYAVDGRTVKRVYTNSRAMKARRAREGRFVIVELKTTGYLVAGQWNPTVIAPMAKKPLWLVSCTGDTKSSAGAATALKQWSSLGAKVDSAQWPLDTTHVARAQEINDLRSKPVTIRYSHLQGGWHNGTWRVAYTFTGIRDWLFKQRKER